MSEQAKRIEELERQNRDLLLTLQDAYNTVLWLERRLPKGYGDVPHVKRTIASLEAVRAGATTAANAAHQEGGAA